MITTDNELQQTIDEVNKALAYEHAREQVKRLAEAVRLSRAETTYDALLTTRLLEALAEFEKVGGL